MVEFISEFSALNLKDDEYVLSLVATGLVQLYEQIAEGHILSYPYPVSLQRGLDRLVALKLARGEKPPKGVPNLIAWCEEPIEAWNLELPSDAVDSHDKLLDRQVPTNVCESWACASSDVEAELSEHHFMKGVFEVSQTANDSEAYAAFRKLMITSPVLNAIEFQTRQIEPQLEVFGDHLRYAYQPASTAYIKDGFFHCCANCGNLLVRTDRNDLLCENERCHIIRAGIGRKISEKEQAYWLRRGLRRFITAPGLAEIRLATAIEERGINVELWPMYDRYDIRIIFPDKDIWAVDVKDWANPFLLARQVKPIPRTPVWDKAFFIFPDERRIQRSDYLRAFRNNCEILGKDTDAMFDIQLLKKIDQKLGKHTNA
ncbi:MAG: hypothetical protein K8L97_08455 [Anaerolineae bacterium]|nr:hypothetical protein [Anaerolineae bacterium]